MIRFKLDSLTSTVHGCESCISHIIEKAVIFGQGSQLNLGGGC